MDDRAGKPRRWVVRPVTVTLPLVGDAHPSSSGGTVDLRDAAGEEIGEARVVVDVQGKRATVTSVRYDADKATWAEAMQALERALREGR